MDAKLEQQLFEKYPLIFQDRHLPMTQTAMCWGLDVADGWFVLLDVLCEQLQWETDRRDAPQVIATQVKEKYGELRFYERSGNDRQEAIIEFATAMSLRICEVCGAPGKLNDQGWFKTRCEAHW